MRRVCKGKGGMDLNECLITIEEVLGSRKRDMTQRPNRSESLSLI